MRAILYSTPEAARYLGIAPSRVRAYIAEGRLKTQMVGGTNVIYESDLEEFARRPRHIGRPKKRRTIAQMSAS